MYFLLMKEKVFIHLFVNNQIFSCEKTNSEWMNKTV